MSTNFQVSSYYIVYTAWLFFIFQMCLINTLSYHVLSVSHICLLKRWIVRIFNAVLETSSIFWLKGTMIISQKMTESFFIPPTNHLWQLNVFHDVFLVSPGEPAHHATRLLGGLEREGAFPWLLVRIPGKHNGQNKEKQKKHVFLHHDSWCQDVFVK